MKIVTKLALSTMGIGTLGGVSYGASKLFRSTTIAEALEYKGHKLLNFDTNKNNDIDIWSPIVNSYLAGTKKFKNLPTITISNNKVEKSNIDELKNACKKIINSSIYEETILLTAEQWCVEPISIKELIGKERNVLATVGDKNNSDWDAKIEFYIKENAKNKFSGVEITKSITTENKESERNKLKNACKSIEENKTHNKDFHNQIKQFVTWCSSSKK